MAGNVGGAGGGELQVPVRLVLDDDHVVAAADGVDLLAAGDGDDEAGWVVAESVFWLAKVSLNLAPVLPLLSRAGKNTHVTVYISPGLFPLLQSQFFNTSSNPPSPSANMPFSSAFTGTICTPFGSAWLRMFP